jgi:hypothetical protein
MPNATARRAAKAAKSHIEDGPTVTAVTDVAGFKIETLGDDYTFTRHGAGRKREPSPFDDVVDTLVGQGTQRIPVEDENAGNECVKLLQKATDYRGRGLEKRVEEHDGAWYVVFKINEAKAKRAPRKSKAEGEDLSDAAEGAETE